MIEKIMNLLGYEKKEIEIDVSHKFKTAARYQKEDGSWSEWVNDPGGKVTEIKTVWERKLS